MREAITLIPRQPESQNPKEELRSLESYYSGVTFSCLGENQDILQCPTDYYHFFGVFIWSIFLLVIFHFAFVCFSVHGHQGKAFLSFGRTLVGVD